MEVGEIDIGEYKNRSFACLAYIDDYLEPFLLHCITFTVFLTITKGYTLDLCYFLFKIISITNKMNSLRLFNVST